MNTYYSKVLKPTLKLFVILFVCLFLVFSIFFYIPYMATAVFCGPAPARGDCGSMANFLIAVGAGAFLISLVPSFFVWIFISFKNLKRGSDSGSSIPPQPGL